MYQARQGDIFFEAFAKPPKGKKLATTVLAHGEITGHSHRIISPSMEELESVVDEAGDIFVRSQENIIISHDEHSEITLPAGGWYHIFRQKEYDPILEQRRLVAD